MAEKREENTNGIRIAPFITILFFLVMGMIGIMTGEVGRVLEQAIQVCFSCIGIG
jgi:hypothetical protein